MRNPHDVRALLLIGGVGLSSALGVPPALAAQEMHHTESHMSMTGLLGPYAMTRESSGTSWQPEATPMDGLHLMQDDWMMLHGMATAIYDDQAGARGGQQVFSTNMVMGMAQRPWGPGTFGARTMLTLEPATIGRKGYPLLLQTGETGDGRTPLIDRQHPHDLFMELAASYSLPMSADSSTFVYVGLPGEPALGPPTFMHRFSGLDNPEAPVTHHWLDSTHVTFGVATVGAVWDRVKIEGSVFNGHEPDQRRWNIEEPRFNSFAGRISYNPTEQWALQVSAGHLDSPEQLEPGVDTDRTTASAIYHQRGQAYDWQTTLAWGQNDHRPGRTLGAWLLESAVIIHQTHTLFARAETVQKDDLFPEGDPQHGRMFRVNKISAGYIYDFPAWHHVQCGIGGLGSVALLPSRLDAAYDETPVSFLVFARAKL